MTTTTALMSPRCVTTYAPDPDLDQTPTLPDPIPDPAPDPRLSPDPDYIPDLNLDTDPILEQRGTCA